MTEQNRTRIAIDLPIPLDVAGTLTKLIAAAYPTATIDARDGHGRQLVIRVDDRDRKRLPGRKRVADTIKDYQDDDPAADGDLTGIDAEGWSFAPSEEIRAALSVMVIRMLEAAGDNYLSWPVRNPENPSEVFEVACARAVGRTPHELRQKAEATLDRVRALIDHPGSITKEALRAALDG